MEENKRQLIEHQNLNKERVNADKVENLYDRRINYGPVGSTKIEEKLFESRKKDQVKRMLEDQIAQRARANGESKKQQKEVEMEANKGVRSVLRQEEWLRQA